MVQTCFFLALFDDVVYGGNTDGKPPTDDGVVSSGPVALAAAALGDPQVGNSSAAAVAGGRSASYVSVEVGRESCESEIRSSTAVVQKKGLFAVALPCSVHFFFPEMHKSLFFTERLNHFLQMKSSLVKRQSFQNKSLSNRMKTIWKLRKALSFACFFFLILVQKKEIKFIG